MGRAGRAKSAPQGTHTQVAKGNKGLCREPGAERGPSCVPVAAEGTAAVTAPLTEQGLNQLRGDGALSSCQLPTPEIES